MQKCALPAKTITKVLVEQDTIRARGHRNDAMQTVQLLMMRGDANDRYRQDSHLANIPEAGGLVLAVGEQVAAVAPGVQMREALCVPDQDACRPVPPQRSPVPHLHGSQRNMSGHE